MNREQKSIQIDKLREKFSKAQIAILTEYKGLKVNQFNDLRLKLHKADAEIQVVKNRLAKIAAKGTPQEGLISFFKGTVALTTTQTDPAAPAKVLVDFAKDVELVQFKAGSMGGKVLSQKDVVALASLPSRDQLIAKLLGSMNAPAQNLVSVLAQIPRQVVNVLAALRDQKEKAGS